MTPAPPVVIADVTWTWRAYWKTQGLAWGTPLLGVFVFAINVTRPTPMWRMVLVAWAVLYLVHTYMLTHLSMWWRVFAHNLVDTGVKLAATAYEVGVEAGRVEDKPWLQANLEEEDA